MTRRDDFFIRASNKREILQEVERLNCKRYDPCPICNKCKIKASHLFYKCSVCSVPICRHTVKEINMMIKPKNFTIKLHGEAAGAFKELERMVFGEA